MFKIIIQDDEGKTTIVPFVREELTIGRKEGNTIRLTERNVSREHAKISRNDSVVSLEDLESYNGIRVNGTKIKGKVDLKVSDRIQIGDYLLEIKPEKTESDTTVEDNLEAQDTNPHVTNVNVAGMAAATKPIIRNPIPDGGKTPLPENSSPTPGAGSLAEETQKTSVVEQPNSAEDKKSAARLVVLSTNYAGDEFYLAKRSMVIGRTEDNDIWLDHRSISRHHAKILREEDRYSVVDLQSSNGVRVNGEVYGKVELRKGDEIDLGHVRLRFVEHGEDFVFARDAEVVDLSKSKSGGGLKWLALLCLLGAIGVGVYFMVPDLMEKTPFATLSTPPVSNSVDKDPPEVEEVDLVDSAPSQNDLPVKAEQNDVTEQAVQNPAVQDVEDDVAKEGIEKGTESEDNNLPEDAAGQGVVDEKLAALMGPIDKARAGEKWRELARLSNAASKKFPEEQKFIDYKILGQRESKAFPRYLEFQRALKSNRYAAAASAFKRIPVNSVYSSRSRGSYDRMRRDYITIQTTKSRNYAENGNCAAQRRLANNVPKQWPEARTSILSVECNPTKTEPSSQPAKVEAATPTNNTPPANDPNTEADGSPADFDALVAESNDAATKSLFGKSYRLCKEALGIKPRDQEAIMICAIASCNLKNEKSAKNYVGKIQSATRKNNVVQICLRNGIEGL